MNLYLVLLGHACKRRIRKQEKFVAAEDEFRNSQAGGRASQKFQSPRASPADIDKEAHEAAVVQELMGVEMFTRTRNVTKMDGQQANKSPVLHPSTPGKPSLGYVSAYPPQMELNPVGISRCTSTTELSKKVT
mmetsp:Transcript_48176/g.151153  ORF Transcript_48176/g.151153 Transcript_48176/m.151153 type:complete len:133 (-) Transcript_48176:107-505(-)